MLLEITKEKISISFIYCWLGLIIGLAIDFTLKLFFFFFFLFFSGKLKLKRALFRKHLCSKMYSFFILQNIKGYHISKNTENKLNAICGFVA